MFSWSPYVLSAGIGILSWLTFAAAHYSLGIPELTDMPARVTMATIVSVAIVFRVQAESPHRFRPFPPSSR